MTRRDPPAQRVPGDLVDALERAREPSSPSFSDAWIGLEPTFQSMECIELFAELEDKDEDRYFTSATLLKKERKIAKTMQRFYEKKLAARKSWCIFDDVERIKCRDPFGVERQALRFQWKDDLAEPMELAIGLDPATFEYGLKPVPLEWLYDDRFRKLLDRLIWGVSHDLGLSTSMLNGGGQFHLSAKTFLEGSLLADDIASRLDHPELATWIMDWPNCDGRSLRATERRFQAFRDVIHAYWQGAFHPRASGAFLVEHALLDRGWYPAAAPPAGLMGARGPLGGDDEIFQTNFAFGRAIKLYAQDVDPGYWQIAHPDDEGFRPYQIPRYSEVNLLRLQIAGELHGKSGRVVEKKRVSAMDAPLTRDMLAKQASIEVRAQMSRTSADDMLEAALLDVHHAMWLQKHPRVRVRASLLQDQLLKDAEHTLITHGASDILARLKDDARAQNLKASKGRFESDFVEPETLFWAAWRVLSNNERAEIAHEAVSGFIERVERAASMDPRKPSADPMEPHRHRPHPLLWEALARHRKRDAVFRERTLWAAHRDRYLARRPVFAQAGDLPPWEDLDHG